MQTNQLRSRLAAGVLLITSMTMSHGQTPESPSTRKFIFDNGLTLLVREDHSAPVLSVQAWVRAGSITEGRWLGAGLSHVLEHMLFKGTPTRGVAQIAQEVEDKGGYINAYTSLEETVYHIDIPSENWATAVDILVDCMMNSTIPADELLKEKDVILREMAMNRDDPARRASYLLWSTAFSTHPYRHPIIGYPDIYNRLTRDDVVAYYKRWYVPNNIIFVVAGDVSATDVERRLRELTKDFKMGAVEPVFIPGEPPQLSLREQHEEMPAELSTLHLAWHVPSMTHPDVYALDVLALIAGQGRSSRLYREVRQRKGLVHSIEASSYTPRYPGLFGIEAQADADKREAAIKAIRAEISRLRDEPCAAAEVQKAVKTAVHGHLSRLRTMEGQASDLASNEILVGDPNFSQVYLENLRKVTADDVQRVARQYLQDNNLTLTTLNPTGTLAQAATKATGRSEVVIQKFELPNGLRVLVREDSKLPLVNVRAVLQGGVFAETDKDNGITKLTARMLLKGTKTRNADQIAEALESVGGAISHFAGNNSFGISAQSLSEDLDRTLELVADTLQNPTFPEAMMARERDVQLAEIKAEQDQVMRVAQQALRTAMFKRHPYRFSVLGTPESVARLTPAQLSAFQQRCVVPGNIVLTVFGNVRASEVLPKIEALFGKMKPGTLKLAGTGPERLSSDLQKEISKDKEQAVLLLGFSGTDIFSKDRFAMELLDEIYSGSGSRLFLRIRDELGLAYYVGAYQLVGLEPGYFVMFVGTTPDKVAVCKKEFQAEIDHLQKEGLSEEELLRAKNSLIGQRRVRMQDNAELSLAVALDELYGLGYDFFKKMDDQYRAVTTDDIRRVAKAYFAGKPQAVVIVKPEK